MATDNKITHMSKENVLAKLSVNLHGDRSDELKNTIVIKFKKGTEPKQYRDVGSGLMCTKIDHTAEIAEFTNWSGKIFAFPLESLLGVLNYDEYQACGGTSDSVADLFE